MPSNKAKAIAGGVLIVWAVGLQVHMWQLQKSSTYHEKFKHEEPQVRLAGAWECKEQIRVRSAVGGRITSDR
ncbi:hypothetical protein WJX73_003624 [Symbiochloris irregularis]|uniref:Uncharacterized protein n=1 Tax=Symbiochloris irregularis TaxID=706552 RepID=A0AAW1NV05_9CHLO